MKKLLLFLLLLSFKGFSQDNYEIQVYGSKLTAVKATMVELHSNFTFGGPDTIANGVYPTNNVFHETIEITHGFTPWLEVGFYFFNSIGSNDRTNYVGSHIRPRFAVPESCGWPIGLSLSLEYGIQRKEFSEDVRSLEIRPIIDKKWNKFYLSLNPVLDKSFKGYNATQMVGFSPNVKTSYDITPVLTMGFEYYGSIGPLNNFYSSSNQQHQLFLAVDLNGSPKWEFNFGVGSTLDPNRDGVILKTIVGRRF